LPVLIIPVKGLTTYYFGLLVLILKATFVV